MAKMRAKV